MSMHDNTFYCYNDRSECVAVTGISSITGCHGNFPVKLMIPLPYRIE